ncbi:hypothetical protein E0700_01200 [Lactobacillus helveticus]|nr:hypothetical protein [Lactobacillus helveticus]MBW8036962.1 hypothetical protein [Lactobacillus helveticus]
MKAKRTNGYSSEVAKLYVPEGTKVVLLSTEPEPRVKWLNHKPTNEITGYRVLCGIPNNFFYVKFKKKVKLPAFKADIKLIGLEACEIENNVWFRAQDIKEV